MRESKFLCIGWIPILLCSLLMLAVTLAFKWRHIELEVAASAEAILFNSEDNWATVETFNQGRNVILNGEAPSAEAAARAEKLASSAYGVRSAKYIGDVAVMPDLRDNASLENGNTNRSSTVTDASSDSDVAVQEIFPAQLLASSSGETITLSGELANQDEIDGLVAEASRIFGRKNVISRLNVGDSVAPLLGAIFLSALKFDADTEAAIDLSVNGSDLQLTGNVPSESLSRELEQSMRERFAGKVSNQLTVSKPIIARDVCEGLVKQLLTDSKINFETGNAEISANSLTLLGRIVTTAKRCPDASFEVAGHTDNTGNANYNMTLSTKRAQSVVTYLVNQGLPATQFNANGYGPTKPIATNSTVQGRAQNRRIEFKLNN